MWTSTGRMRNQDSGFRFRDRGSTRQQRDVRCAMRTERKARQGTKGTKGTQTTFFFSPHSHARVRGLVSVGDNDHHSSKATTM